MVEEDLRSSAPDFIILSELRYGSLVGVDNSLGTAKEKELTIINGHKESEIEMHKQGTLAFKRSNFTFHKCHHRNIPYEGSK